MNKTSESLLYLLSFFMSLNIFAFFGTNISFLIFLLFFGLNFKFGILRITSYVQLLPLLIIFAAIVVSFYSNEQYSAKNNSFNVLPNYIYWSLLIIVFISLENIFDFFTNERLFNISKYIFYGLVINSLIYFFFYDFEILKPFLTKYSSNQFAYNLVCFTSISFYYSLKRFGRIITFIIFIFFIFSLLVEERRAGFILVTLSILFSYFKKIRLKSIFNILFLTLIFISFLSISNIERFIESRSQRIHTIVYKSSDVLNYDKSYLIRRAMVEKSIIIFKENMINGIGLNNFPKYNVNIKGNFKGFEYISNKQLNNKSAHNSYLVILSEGGLILAMPIFLLILFNLFNFFKNYNNFSSIELSYLISSIAMFAHLYFISAILNVFTWFLISIVTVINLKMLKK